MSTTTLTADRVHTTVTSPVGPLTLVATGGVLSGLYLDAQRHLPDEDTFGPRDPGPFREVEQQLAEYFVGDRTTFDLPLHLAGSDFQRRVWTALREVPYGETWSYGQLAAHIGSPGASRAVGLANGRNPIAIIVPCHRVIGANGKLTGYGGGLERKQQLLDLEQDGAGRLF